MTAARVYKTMSERYAHGGPLHRFPSIKPKGHRVNLRDDHPALAGATIFPTRVFDVDEVPRVLISGVNSRKIGKTVMKGRWRGYPIFTLTLEERATCPSSCAEWRTCYGNSMHMARRVRAGDLFERYLWDELHEAQRSHPRGFVVRLHVLGDFYSVGYVSLWEQALADFPALRVFGYTARQPFTDPIGAALNRLVQLHEDRFALRFSGLDLSRNGAIVVDAAADTEHLICPAQTGKTECCATCALCWHSDRTIAFLRH
jgi:hypothetical protein